MFRPFHVIAARLKALFSTDCALDFEADFASRNAERKAELLRQAAEYEKEGLKEVAAELRQRASEIDMRTPLASVLPSITHLKCEVDNEPINKPLLTNHQEKADKPAPKKRK